MRNEIYFFVFVWIGILSVNCLTINADTIPLPEVHIQASRESYFSTINQTSVIDSAARLQYGNSNLGDLLQFTSPVLVNNYGLGASSTISMRGTADDHTILLWNGVPVKSNSLGSTDVSLIPVNPNDQISIVTNSASSVYGSGTFGGAILINNAADWMNRFNMIVRYDYGNFDSHNAALHLSTGNTKIQFQTNGYYQHATNNFIYKDVYQIDQPKVEIKNNALSNWATISTVFIKLKKSQLLQIGNWSQEKGKEIPAIMGGSLESTKFQKDFSQKNYVYYQKIFKKGLFYNRSSVVYDYQRYSDDGYNIYSVYKTIKFSNSLNYRYYFKRPSTIDAGIDYGSDRADITEYKKPVVEYRAAFFFASKYNFKQFQFQSGLRQEVNKYKYIRPLFSFNISYVHPNKRIFIDINYADKFRQPDLNDKYWWPGGNVHLLPEKGFTVEWNNSYQLLKLTNKDILQFSYSLYYTSIKDNIVWIPITSTFWTPENIKSTAHFGVDAKLKSQWNIHANFKINSSLIYSYNHSIITKNINRDVEGNFIRYKPQHTMKANLMFDDKYFSLAFNYNFISSRFSDEENNSIYKLKPYHLLDMYIAYKLSKNTFNTLFSFQINNVLNTSYETIRSYAQPLRNYVLSVQFNYSIHQ